jgi:nitroimidazol reductase NimA-like FMN-containing flavoprotein (pyridoxamine 5'-phosphate oxidase superfamily)
MRAMDWAEASQFLLARTRTATIATIGRDGHPHVVPVWFTLDGRRGLFDFQCQRKGEEPGARPASSGLRG